jgi:response regulator RpfG family c-di-GMP phosphodiesterase/nitrogen-specific signal transduction histidine kinase
MPSNPQRQVTPDIIELNFSLVKELFDVILVTDNISATANLILDILVKYTGTGKCSLMLTNERGELYMQAARGIDIDLVRNYRVKLGEGIAGTVAKSLLPVLVENIEKDTRFRSTKQACYKTKSFVSCPIVGKKRLIGVLNASDKSDLTPFTEDEFTLIQVIVHQAAIALENAFLVTRLRGKAAELEEMNRKLMDTDVVKTEFLTRISHELRTPLNSIKGSAYYLENAENIARSKQKEFYSIISKETDKLTAIVENQLDFLRYEDETRTLNQSVINLAEVLKEISRSNSLSALLARKNLSLDIRIGKEAPDIVGDKIKTAQMLLNLIEGLAFYLERGEKLQISFTQNHSIHVKITVNARFPDEVLSIFSRASYPLQEEGRDEKLKIYLARKVADIHGWNITVKNDDSAFVVDLDIPRSERQKINTAVGKSIDLFLEFISELLCLDICSVMLSDDVTGELKIQSARGLADDIIKRTRIRPGDQICGWVAMEGKPLLIEDIENDPRFGKRNIPQYNTKSLLSIPLKIRDRVVGVLNMNNKKTAEPFVAQDLQLATVLGARVSSLIEKLHADENWEDGFRDFTASFDELLTAGRKYHKKTRLVRDLVRRIMEQLEASEEEKNLALYVSTVYDLGLMLMDDAVLHKKKLGPSEIASMKIHPFTTVELLNSFEFSQDVKQAILHHHERYDGGGYPNGLAGDDIPLISRVIAVVDGYCAMISKRPYRKTFTGDSALEEIRKGSGSCYDPLVVQALGKAVEQLNS